MLNSSSHGQTQLFFFITVHVIKTCCKTGSNYCISLKLLCAAEVYSTELRSVQATFWSFSIFVRNVGRDNFTLLYFTLLCFTLPYFTLLYSTLLYSTLLYSTLLYSTLLYSTLLYFTLLYFTLLYFTLLYFTLTFKIVTVNRDYLPEQN